jgi:TolA-binding protein
MPRVPSIPTSSLRDYAGSERLDRIWKRVQPDLLSSRRTLARPPRSFWIPATLVAVFCAGVFVGRTNLTPEKATTFTPEQPFAPEPAARPAAAPAGPAAPTVEPRTPQTRKNHAVNPAQPAELISLAAPEVPAPVIQSAPVGPPEWERLAADDKTAEAMASIDAHGGFATVVAGATATQLMTLADISRSAGGRDQAILALRRVVDAFPEAAEAPVAAWTLGKLLDKAGDGAGAAEAFALYRRLSPGGDFAEDALARQVDSALAQGNLEELARLVAQYENDFPNGQRLEEFRAELAKQRGAANAPADPNAAAPDKSTGHAKESAPAEAPKPPSN